MDEFEAIVVIVIDYKDPSRYFYRKNDFPHNSHERQWLAIFQENDTITRSNELASKALQVFCESIAKKESNPRLITDGCYVSGQESFSPDAFLQWKQISNVQQVYRISQQQTIKFYVVKCAL